MQIIVVVQLHKDKSWHHAFVNNGRWHIVVDGVIKPVFEEQLLSWKCVPKYKNPFAYTLKHDGNCGGSLLKSLKSIMISSAAFFKGGAA